MFEYTTSFTVRYAETDQMGIVHHSNYAVYYELAMVEAMSSLGSNYRAMEESGILMPILNIHSVFKAPLRFDDKITIKVLIKKMPLAKILFEYELYTEKGTLAHLGSTELGFVTKDEMKPCRVPGWFADCLRPFFD